MPANFLNQSFLFFSNASSNPTTPLTLFEFDKKYLEGESLLQGTGGAV